MKRIIFIAALFIFAVQAQSQDLEAIKSQIKEYTELNIHPRMQEWKSKIDGEINKEELQRLEQMRAEASKLRNQELEMMRNFTPEKGKGKPRQTEIRGQFKELHNELSKMIEQHSNFFNQLNDEIKPIAQKWREDIQKMKMDWKQSYKQANSCKYKGEMCDGHGKRGKMKHARKFMNNPQHDLYRVMLWNGKSIDGEVFGFQRLEQSFGEMSANVFPNPSSGAVYFEFDAPKTGLYELVISDVAGNIITSEKVNVNTVGKLNHSINGLNLSNGVYTYTISSDGKMQSGRFAIQK